MAKGKQTCKILKEIRKQIAAENDIKLVIEECTYQGDCKGTCPKCEAEVRYLERELEKRQRMGKAAVFAGMSLGTLFAATSCNHPILQPTEGDPVAPDTTEMQNSNDTVPNDTLLFEGDVVGLEADTVENDKRTACKSSEPLKIPGDVIVVDEAVGEDVTEGFVESFAPSPIEGEVEDPENDVYQIVQEMPKFPGGDKELFQFVADHIKYPEEAKKADTEGRVYVGFIVEPDGSLSDFKVLRGIGHGCDEEALRVVKSMPKWQPGMHRGKAVRVQYLVPVNFRLEEKQD